jgi:hypothetical protein
MESKKNVASANNFDGEAQPYDSTAGIAHQRCDAQQDAFDFAKKYPFRGHAL